jgi:hypothetical protein
MNVSIFSQMTYENKSNWTFGENKPKQTQFLEAMFVTFYATVYYERKSKFAVRKGRPNSQILEFTTASRCGARILTPEG